MATALVTGGTAGIGNAFCRHLAARGYDLVIVARDVERMTTLAAQLNSAYGAEVEILPADLSIAAEVTAVADRVEDPDRPIDLVVNNAGFGLHGALLDKSNLATQRKAMEVMCWAVLEISSAAGRAMKHRGHGTIINVASTSAWIMSGNYSAIKAWCLSFTQGLAGELHGTGVKVSALCPGWVHTEFHDRAGISAGNLPGIVWVNVDTLVQESLDDAEAGRAISIPTWKWKAAIGIAQHAPRFTMRMVSRALSSSRRKSAHGNQR